jgi:hypothetical protein
MSETKNVIVDVLGTDENGHETVVRTYDAASLEEQEAPITDPVKAAEAFCSRDKAHLTFRIRGAKPKAGGKVKADDASDEDEVVYAELSVADLLAEVKARKLKGATTKSTAEQLIAILEADDAAE